MVNRFVIEFDSIRKRLIDAGAPTLTGDIAGVGGPPAVEHCSAQSGTSRVIPSGRSPSREPANGP